MNEDEFALTFLHRYRLQIDTKPDGQKIVRPSDGRALTKPEKEIADGLTKFYAKLWKQRGALDKSEGKYTC